MMEGVGRSSTRPVTSSANTAPIASAARKPRKRRHGRGSFDLADTLAGRQSQPDIGAHFARHPVPGQFRHLAQFRQQRRAFPDTPRSLRGNLRNGPRDASSSRPRTNRGRRRREAPVSPVPGDRFASYRYRFLLFHISQHLGARVGDVATAPLPSNNSCAGRLPRPANLPRRAASAPSVPARSSSRNPSSRYSRCSPCKASSSGVSE